MGYLHLNSDKPKGPHIQGNIFAPHLCSKGKQVISIVRRGGEGGGRKMKRSFSLKERGKKTNI